MAASSPLARARLAFLRRTVGPRPLWRPLTVGPSGINGHLKLALVQAFRGNSAPASYNHPGEARVWEAKNTVNSTPLCPCGEPPLDDSPSVVTGSSVDCNCTEQLAYGVQELQTQPSAPLAMWGMFPRSPKGTGTLALFNESLKRYFRKAYDGRGTS